MENMGERGSMERYVSPGNREEKKQYDEEKILRMLKHPEGPVDVVLDTDTYNEGDDQFAMAYMIRSAEKLRVKGIYAAPFYSASSGRAQDPADGMEKSYDEIFRLLKLLHKEDMYPLVKRGAAGYLADEKTLVVSEAAEAIRFASEAAAVSVSRPGAQMSMPTRAEVKR